MQRFSYSTTTVNFIRHSIFGLTKIRTVEMIQRWYKSRHGSIIKLVLLFGSIASILTLYDNFFPNPKSLPWWADVLLILTAFFLVILFILELRARPKRRVYSKRDNAGILKYMHEWIEHGGRVAIWTRDMSWANNEKTERLLTRKAKRQELLLFLPTSNALADRLSNAGAAVHYYGTEFLESPASRFTIANFGRAGSSVAVGRPSGDSHVIDEFTMGDHPAFHMAADLISLTRSFSSKNS